MADGGVVQLLFSGEQNSPLLASNGDDIEPINGVVDFGREFLIESKRLWCLAAPAMFTYFCQYGLITVTQIFAGHLGTVHLAAVSVENSIISGFPFALIYGMSSALETYCGQAYGANQYEMLGIYMQRTWLILNAVALAFLPLFLFATPVLRLLGQTPAVSREAGRFAVWMNPEHFAYAMTYPSTKFLQAQSKVVVLAAIATAALCLHASLTWLLVSTLGWGLVGAAVALDASWWFIAVAQFAFVVAGSCGEAWSGLSWRAFHDLWKFVKVSLASAMMTCMEIWYSFALTLFAGYLEDAEISIDAFSICMNVLGWSSMVATGLTIATSVRVSNELGRGQPGRSRLAVVVGGVSSLLTGLLFTIILVASRKQYPAIFSSNEQVQKVVEELTPLLGISIVFSNVQYTLQGVAIGAGWQVRVAYLSVGCYFLLGVPFGTLMAYKFEMGLKGLWCGMVIGLCMQTGLLLWIICIANWNKECLKAGERLKQWSVERRGKETS
ncbi:protein DETOXIFICATION 30-like [Salvia splendens]|uniref:protein DETOXIFICATION 30-like n=1 Tax=Salvia splendens TaxID=180675 RepID=UPI001C268AE3|nr:protein DETOXIFICATION 30-like [Salvia splendens]